MIKLKSTQLTTCLELRDSYKMDWSSRLSDSYSESLSHQAQLLMLTPTSTECRHTRTEFSSIKVSKLTGLLNGDTLISPLLVSGPPGLSPQQQTTFSCHPSFPWPSSQEDGFNRDTSLGTLNSCHTLSKSFSTNPSSSAKYQSTS